MSVSVCAHGQRPPASLPGSRVRLRQASNVLPRHFHFHTCTCSVLACTCLWQRELRVLAVSRYLGTCNLCMVQVLVGSLARSFPVPVRLLSSDKVWGGRGWQERAAVRYCTCLTVLDLPCLIPQTRTFSCHRVLCQTLCMYRAMM